MAGPDTPKGGFLGSLRDALAAAGREEQAATGAEIGPGGRPTTLRVLYGESLARSDFVKLLPCLPTA